MGESREHRRAPSEMPERVSDMAEREIGVGIIGLGFMGRTHLRAYRDAARQGDPCRVVATSATRRADWDELISGDGAAKAGNIAQAGASEAIVDPSEVRFYEDWRELAADPGVDLVSVCTPTDTHAAIAIELLRAGKHVLVEKPVALSSARAREVAQAAADARTRGVLCMPAHCMRFWNGWDWLKARVQEAQDGSRGPNGEWGLGKLRALTLQRMGSRPGWSPAYYNDPARCGGALFDLHIHDADVVLWLLGAPDEVSSVGHVDHIVTQYRFARGPALVVAEGGWVADGFPFRMRYTAEFEGGVADWDLARPEPLQVSKDGKSEAVALPPLAGYDGEIRHFVRAIAALRRGERVTLDVTPEDAARVCRLLELEHESATRGTPVAVGDAIA